MKCEHNEYGKWEDFDDHRIRVCLECGDVDVDPLEPPVIDVNEPDGDADHETMDAINHLIDHVYNMLNDDGVNDG